MSKHTFILKHLRTSCIHRTPYLLILQNMFPRKTILMYNYSIVTSFRRFNTVTVL